MSVKPAITWQAALSSGVSAGSRHATAREFASFLDATDFQTRLSDPYSRGKRARLDLADTVTRHALLWLNLGNLLGLILAILLLWPDLGILPSQLGYGRLLGVHMEMQLYGWCALPLVGLL